MESVNTHRQPLPYGTSQERQAALHALSRRTIHQVRQACTFGSPNFAVDTIRTGGWVTVQERRLSLGAEERNDPIARALVNLTIRMKQALGVTKDVYSKHAITDFADYAAYALDRRAGVCLLMASLAMHFILEQEEIQDLKLEIAGFNRRADDIDHAFLKISNQYGESVFCDPWAQQTFTKDTLDVNAYITLMEEQVEAIKGVQAALMPRGYLKPDSDFCRKAEEEPRPCDRYKLLHETIESDRYPDTWIAGMVKNEWSGRLTRLLRNKVVHRTDCQPIRYAQDRELFQALFKLIRSLNWHRQYLSNQAVLLECIKSVDQLLLATERHVKDAEVFEDFKLQLTNIRQSLMKRLQRLGISYSPAARYLAEPIPDPVLALSVGLDALDIQRIENSAPTGGPLVYRKHVEVSTGSVSFSGELEYHLEVSM